MKTSIFILLLFCLSIETTMAQGKIKKNLLPKNIIVFIADGGGYNQMLVTNHFWLGSDGFPLLDSFNVRLALSTYPASMYEGGALSYDSRRFWKEPDYAISGFTESAAAATALACGFKTKNGRIGSDVEAHALVNVSEMAKLKNKAVGVVTSVPISHATPAGFSAHNASRKKYGEIFLDQVFNSQIDVLIGAGHPYYDDNGMSISKASFDYVFSEALFNALKSDTLKSFRNNDRAYLVQDINNDNKRDSWMFADSRKKFESIASGEEIPTRLLGILPVKSTIQAYRAGESKVPFDIPSNPDVPSLELATKAALQVVSKDKDGFFLMVEGGAIDWANHDNNAARLVEEYIAFYQSIEACLLWLKEKGELEQTLIIVTSDHECGYLWGKDGIYSKPSFVAKNNLDQVQYFSTNHSNSLVPFFAHGPGSQKFLSLADEVDSVRGAYITNSEIALTLKSFLCDEALVLPRYVSQSQGQCQIYCASNVAGVKYQWRRNSIPIHGATESSLLLSGDLLNPGTIYDVELRYGNTTWTAKSITINK